MKRKTKWIVGLLTAAAVLLLLFFLLRDYGLNCSKKPVLYLYPAREQTVTVRLGFHGTLTCTCPAYKNGWKVKAEPDGTLTDLSDGKTYSCLFWEGVSFHRWDMTKGFVVKGSDTAEFLRQKLSYLGLKPKECNGFLAYWLPVLQKSPYNLITFSGKDYERLAPLDITPRPDSVLRVMMLYKPLNRPVNVQPQTLKPFVRKGFAVVEWGGTRVG